MKEKILIFDASPLISFAMNGLLPELKSLKETFEGKFIITKEVKYEIIDRPITIKRFELEALKLQELINEIKVNHNYNKHHAFSYKSAFGSLVEILSRFTQKHPVDLIVLGAKGMSAVEKIVFGSNTYAVIKEIDCPALVIPDNTLFIKPANIGIATDFKELKNKAIFSVLKSIKEDYQPKITLFNVTEEDKLITDKENIFTKSIANLLEIEHLSSDYFTNEDVIFGTNEFVNQRKINLLVLINKKRSFLQNLFHISFTKQIAFHAEVPILVLHD